MAALSTAKKKVRVNAGLQTRPFGVSRSEDAYGLAVEIAADILDDMRKIRPVVLFRHVTEMRRDYDIVELAVRMIDGQRFDVIDIQAGTRDLAVAQHIEQRSLVDDRTA